MKVIALKLTIVFLSVFSLLHSMHLIDNPLKEIDSCMGRIDLKLMRVWGDDDAEDPNQFFKIPKDIKIHKAFIYIVDSRNHNIQVFDFDGHHVNTIGRKGQGPGDFLQPSSLVIDQQDRLIVADYGNKRIQILNLKGQYLSCFNTNTGLPSYLALTASGKIAVHSSAMSMATNKLLALYEYDGKFLGYFGNRILARASSTGESESVLIFFEKQGNLFFTYYATPFFQKISTNGDVLLSVAYGVPFKAPKVEMQGKELRWIPINKYISNVAQAIGADESGRHVFMVTAKRPMNENEMVFLVDDSPGDARIVKPQGVPEGTDRHRLLVFNKAGKIIAAQDLSVFCDKIYLYNGRIFIIDSYRELKIYEYVYQLKP